MNILEIDIGEGFIPIGCLTGFSESEQTQTIPTTTRDNDGWRTVRGVYQTKSISFSAYMSEDIGILSYAELALIKRAGTVFDWRVEDDDGRGFFTEISIDQSAGEEVQYSATIRVSGRPSPDPQLPFVDAGTDITLAPGETTAELSGFVLNPDGSAITYQWTFVSGPVTPVITNSTTLTPEVTGMTVVGIYVFRLTATNDAGSASDTVSVGEVGVAPGISISLPSPRSLIAPGTFEFTITYIGADAITLDAADVTLNTTGTVSATRTVTGTGPTTRMVNVAVTSGIGSVSITIAPGTASNTNGSAPGAGPSVVGQVVTTPPPAPSGYNVYFVDDPIQNNNTLIAITAGNGEGDEYSAAIVSSGGGSPLVINGSFGATPTNIPLNVSSLPNGTLTMNFTVQQSTGSGTQSIPNVTTEKLV